MIPETVRRIIVNGIMIIGISSQYFIGIFAVKIGFIICLPLTGLLSIFSVKIKMGAYLL